MVNVHHLHLPLWTITLGAGWKGEEASITRYRSRAFPLEAAWMTLQQIEIDGHLTSGRMTFAVFGVNLDSQENKMQYLKRQFFRFTLSLIFDILFYLYTWP